MVRSPSVGVVARSVMGATKSASYICQNELRLPVHRPGAEAGVAGQLAGGCVGRQADDHVQVLGGDLSERDSGPAEGHSRDGVVVAPEDAPVHALVGPVERVAQPGRFTATRLAGEHDHLAEAEPLDLVHGGLVPAANVALVEHDADPKLAHPLDQLLEQRDPAVRHRLG